MHRAGAAADRNTPANRGQGIARARTDAGRRPSAALPPWKAWFPKSSVRELTRIASPAGAPASRIGALDGLRAVAVAAVVVYHFAPGLLPSGFLGVDVFMVVSGFIVTNLLLRERQRNGRINIAAFWGRRFRRLVPALVVMVIVVTELVRRFDPPSVAGAARSQGLSALVYLTNWKLIVSGVSYGGAVGSRSPFVHLWSLAVEEQFYLIWPVVLVALLAISRKRVWPVLTATIVATVASMAWMAHLYDPAIDPLRIYYGTDTRAQAFLIGAIGAFVLPYLGTRCRNVLRMVAPVALLGVLLAMTTDAPGFLYRGGFGLIAFGAVLATVATTVPGPLAAALDRPGFRELGRVSYGVYLWHWPTVTLLTADRLPNPLALLGARLAFTAAGTALSWALVERPLHIARPRRIALTGGAGVTAATLALVALPAGHAYAYSDMRTDRVPTPIVHRAVGARGLDVHVGTPAPAAASERRRARAPRARNRDDRRRFGDVLGDARVHRGAGCRGLARRRNGISRNRAVAAQRSDAAPVVERSDAVPRRPHDRDARIVGRRVGAGARRGRVP